MCGYSSISYVCKYNKPGNDNNECNYTQYRAPLVSKVKHLYTSVFFLALRDCLSASVTYAIAEIICLCVQEKARRSGTKAEGVC